MSKWVYSFRLGMAAAKPTRFCCCLSLRQGSILIGVIEMTIAAFALLLLMLGAERAEAIAKEAAADVGSGFWESTGGALVFTDGETFTEGQQFASVVTFLMYAGVVVFTTHLMTSFLMLFGAVKGIPRLLLPWTSLVFLFLMFTLFSLISFIFMPYNGCKTEIVIIGIIVYLAQFHSYMVVLGHYQELVNAAACRMATNILVNYDLVSPVHKPRADI